MTNQKQILITKAVIPASGLGTRMLPFTKEIPKELLPIGTTPVIQIVCENLVKAGIKEIAIVIRKRGNLIEKYFGKLDTEYLDNLNKLDKFSEIENLEKISKMAKFTFIEQIGPYGNATPILNAKEFIKDDPFIYAWPDSFILTKNKKNTETQLIESFYKTQNITLAGLIKNKPEDYKLFGYAILKGNKLTDIVEKPGAKLVNKHLAMLGTIIFTPEIISYIEKSKVILKQNEELSYTNALKLMLNDNIKISIKKVIGGTYYDVGNKKDYQQTQKKLGEFF